ncbi:MAG: hypothetical protein KDD36_14420 [Flavobacteriales bacterium]|nr:hypothetical protein [Flavobacteriales bacterium]
MKTNILTWVIIGSALTGACSTSEQTEDRFPEGKESKIAVSELPQTAVDYAKKEFPGYTWEKKAERIETKEGVFYEVELKGNGQEVELIFNEAGQFVDKKVEGDDHDGEKDDDGDEEEDDD